MATHRAGNCEAVMELKKALLASLVIALLQSTVFGAEPDQRLVELAKERQRLEEQADRGRLLIENAQLKFRELVEQEKKIQAEINQKSDVKSQKSDR